MTSAARASKQVGDRLRAVLPQLDIVLSSEVLREFREFP